MVLGAIVLAMIFGVVIDMFGSSERSAMDNKAQKSATLAAEMLTSDLRAMRAPHREPRWTGSPDNLRSMLLDGANPTNLQVHDLLVAAPSRVMFYVELIPNTPINTTECVTWFVRADGSMQREVRAYAPGCGSGTATRGGGGDLLQGSQVMPAPERARATAAAAIPNPFRYRMLRVANPANPDPASCTTQVQAGPLDVLRRDQVMNVEMDLRSFVAGRVARGDQQLQTSVTISSRQGMEYRYGIGCVA